VFVITVWSNLPAAAGALAPNRVSRFAINGKAWPNTERLTYDVGDSVRFRVVNASVAVHPMHLHGFYFNVNSRGDGARDTTFDARRSPRLVVTERLAPFRTMSMTWVPERPGYWLFHCHDNVHTLRSRPLDGTPLPAEHLVHPSNHAREMMGGLVMGVEIRPARATVARAVRPADEGARRVLRLVARADSGGTDAEPAYGYVLHDGARTTPNAGPLVPGPTIVLKRGEPVAITVVNQLGEPTAVHWHGIELDSYFDGVADFSGHPGRVSPAIAPRDSFVARFTPPRSGTFMYHPHADELRQQMAGLSGAIVVVDDPAKFDAERDLVFLMSTPRRIADRPTAIFLNGSMTPAPRELRVGERYRLRIINLHTARPGMIAHVLRDTLPVQWRAVAKDGMDLPPDQVTLGPARQQLGNGEAYDFELVPDAPGELRFLVTTGAGIPLATMMLRVLP
jgi:manganese oxidase